MADISYSVTELAEKYKQYLEVNGDNFKFNHIEFMESLHSQYRAGKTLSDAQNNAFMKFIVNHEIHEFLNTDAYLNLNLADANGARISNVNCKVLTAQISTRNRFNQSGTEQYITITAVTPDNLQLYFKSTNSDIMDLRADTHINISTMLGNGKGYMKRVRLSK